MRQYYRDILSKRLRDIFDDRDAETVLTWMISNDGRRPVVVVGAGFSLNAEQKRTGLAVSRSDVPLWVDVINRFANDLRIDKNAYEPLTFAELYREEVESATFNSTLLDMVKDDDIVAGKAHRALFDYPAEAIVTTNQLDTLLDQNRRSWRRIVCDPDLAIGKPNANCIDLIYFHGHRENRTSWGFTRSQYEDIYKTRPLIVTRVRQLLSQHPVLIVGYSLSDPDFHHIYRQLSLDMSYHHPLGLALFPFKLGPRIPERRHWEKLGIRIASFNGNRSTSESFKSFFEINPAPTATLEEASSIEEWVRSGSDFVDRMRRALDFLSDPNRSDNVRTSRHSDHQIWISIIKAEFPEEEWEEINTIRVDDLQYDETQTAAPTASRRKSNALFRGFKVLPRDRFSTQESRLRQIDAFLFRRKDLCAEIARWMKFGYENRLLESDDPLYLDLLSWIWARVAQGSQNTDSPIYNEARDMIRRVLADALRYSHSSAIEHIRADAQALGLDVSGVDLAGDRSSEFLQGMRNGFEKLLDGAFEDARKSYEHAGLIAQNQGDVVGTWIALLGEQEASLASIGPLDHQSKPVQVSIEALRRRCAALEQERTVKEWLELASRRREATTQRIIRQAMDQVHKRMFGGRSWSWSADVFHYWTMFRDLEVICASPSQQRLHVQPLIDLGAFPPDEELRHRLRLGVEGAESTVRWVARIINQQHVTIDSMRSLHGTILNEFVRATTTKKERARRLDLLPAMTTIFRVSDIKWARSFISEFVDEARGKSQNYGRAPLIKALCSYAELESDASVIDCIEECLSLAQTWGERYEFARLLRRDLPLEQWVGLHDAAERLACVIFQLDQNADPDKLVKSHGDLCWALQSILRGTRRFNRPLAEGTLSNVRIWSERLLRTVAEPDVLSAAVHAVCLATADDAAREDIVKDTLERVISMASHAEQRNQGLESAITLWGNFVEAGVSPTNGVMAGAAGQIWAMMDGVWDSVLRRSDPVITDTWVYVMFLVEVIASGVVDAVSEARGLLLQLLRASPQHLDICGKILDSRFWDDRWLAFVDHVWACSAGIDSGEHVSTRLGVVGLLRNWLVHSKMTGDELNHDIAFVVDASMLAIVDVSPIVANHAAYNIVGYAERARSDRDVQRVVAALRRLRAPKFIPPDAGSHATG